jgi:hypothetical protein
MAAKSPETIDKLTDQHSLLYRRPCYELYLSSCVVHVEPLRPVAYGELMSSIALCHFRGTLRICFIPL